MYIGGNSFQLNAPIRVGTTDLETCRAVLQGTLSVGAYGRGLTQRRSGLGNSDSL
jgi:hypothetical protein